MGQVTVTIAGRSYRMACEDGEEDRLSGLARSVDEKIGQMRATFGEIGDQRLIVMSAIAFADELSEAQQKLSDVLSLLDEARAEVAAASDRNGARTEQIAEALDQVSERLERLARSLNAAGKD